jgi:UDP-GlcNAc:undecaprenyl-phosphate GlcNAc-1-phosphate transferase
MYFFAFIAAFALAVFFTYFVRKVALRFNIVDEPNGERKIHKKPIPLLGGLAIFLSFFLVLGFFLFFTDKVLAGQILAKHFLGIFIGSVFLMIGGVLDDKYNLRAKWQIIWPIFAAIAVIVSGIGINYITNPLGGLLQLDKLKLVLFHLNGVPYRITLFSDIFTFLWLLGMMYTTKLLDGLDGLVSGITTIGAIIIFFVSLAGDDFQPETAMVSIILAGAFAGFLIWNFNPAKIFLGEGGSIFAGFMLGSLSIIAGSKIATTLLIIGLPMIDVLIVIIQRLFKNRKIFSADKRHLHFRLLEAGLSQRQAVVILYLVTIIFGIATLVLKTEGKLLVFGFLFILSVILSLIVLKKGGGVGGG